MKKSALLLLLLAMVPSLSSATQPQCASWPVNMALVHLKNAGITNPARIDETKTQPVLLASEKIGTDLYHQIYDITFHEKSGRLIQVVTSSNASSDECSMSGVEVYVVSRKLGGQ